MFYTPHILQKQVTPGMGVDRYGRPIPVEEFNTFAADGNLMFFDGRLYVDDSDKENLTYWVNVCKCRCDHNGDSDNRQAEGIYTVPAFRVVCEGKRPDIEVGDRARCVTPQGEIRGEGIVEKKKTLNYLEYAEVYF